ncbi:hypothetical protein FIBSPDRAFT_897423 [Athelia psychrophila]|uniref:Uncharacterized protein n=1 Tax=Athelia psychrophila TaxID=1759441 RepID=A0A166C7X5_9AGAM|nr:hypothetical protein FIBSPDRAFT_897423 [Fibularhizoctonia sp. CBS 109695]
MPLRKMVSGSCANEGVWEWVRRELRAGWGSHMGLGAHMGWVACLEAGVGTWKVGCGCVGFSVGVQIGSAHGKRTWGLGSAYGVNIGARAQAWGMGVYTYGQDVGTCKGRQVGWHTGLGAVGAGVGAGQACRLGVCTQDPAASFGQSGGQVG